VLKERRLLPELRAADDFPPADHHLAARGLREAGSGADAGSAARPPRLGEHRIGAERAECLAQHVVDRDVRLAE
jgi:hypothetical protein